ncbi:MAG: class I SAM-dependent methyltransferase [bacterium]|nr:class I SAM-dependent methyltransferase [bacterium]
MTNIEAGPDITELRGPDGVDSCLQSGTRAAWNERYSTRGMPPGAEANQFVAAFASGLSPRRVLDLGCGQGRNAVWLALEGHSVTGIDQSEVAIGQARQLAAASGVEVRFETGDIVQDWVPTPGSFDLAVLSYLQLPAEARTVAHAKVRSALADGGTVFLVAHHSDNLRHGVGGPPYPQVLFDEATLAADFAALRISTNKKIFRDVAGADGEIRQARDILLVAEKPRS